MAYVAAGKVTTLKHELRDDAMKHSSLVAESLLARAEGAEVLGRPRDLLVEEDHVDPSGLL